MYQYLFICIPICFILGSYHILNIVVFSFFYYHMELYFFTVFCSVSTTQNSQLTSPFTKEEAWSAVCSYGENKSMGPYGLNFFFYNRFWDDLISEFMQLLYRIHNTSFLSMPLRLLLRCLFQKFLVPR